MKTGARRYRFGFGRCLVLQVEEKILRTRLIGGQIDTETVLEWRDARIEDLSEEIEAGRPTEVVARPAAA